MNKSKKIILSIIIILIMLWIIIFSIDFIRCTSFKMPIFVLPAGETADDGGSGIYYGLGYRVIVEKNISTEYGLQLTKLEMYIGNKFIAGAITDYHDYTTYEEIKTSNTTPIEKLPPNYGWLKAVKDDCVVRNNSSKIYNTDILDDFVQKVRNNEPCFIRCIDFTIEGDMVITDVNFEGNSVFKVCRDSTRDRFSNEANRTYSYATFSKIIIDDSNNGLKISLEEPTGGYIQSIVVSGYEQEDEKINDYQNNYLLLVKENGKYDKQKIISGEYDIYYYGLDSVKILIDNEEMELKEALSNNKVTMEQIIEQAQNDRDNEIIYSDMYKDGGTMEYYYDTYTIIKSNSLNGNRDVYIGIPEMRLNQVR